MNKLTLNSRGISRLTMKNDALSPNYFKADERSLFDMMNYVSEFSKHVQFINLDNEQEGNWRPFFESNIAFLLAEIAGFDPKAFEQKFISITRKLERCETENEQKTILKELIKTNYFLFELINSWFKASKKDPEHLKLNDLYLNLNGIIRSEFKHHLQTFISSTKAFQELVPSFNENSKWFQDFDSAWEMSSIEDKTFTSSRGLRSLESISKSQTSLLRSLTSLVIHLKNDAPKVLNNLLVNYPHHEPHISLIISFLMAFQHVQDDLNNTIKKHLEFYLKDVLHQDHRHPLPDQVHLAFDPADHVLKSIVSKNTLMVAGPDEEGIDLTYSLNHDIELNKGFLSQIKVLHVANNDVIGIGKLYKDISNIYSSDIKLNDEGWVLDSSGNPNSSYLFGRDQANISFENRDMAQASIGFALSSPTLLLAEGQRNVSLTFKFQLKSLASLISFVEELSALENITADSALYKILNNIFNVRITSDKGWYETDNYSIVRSKSWTDGEIQINLSLDISAPPIVAYDEELHGPGFSTQWPIFEFTVDSKNAMYSYSYIKSLIVESCTIDVSVERLRNISVFNDIGPIDINTPFYPFGSAPELGAYFLIGSEELFKKELTDLSLDIQWHNLPRTKGGFKTYYKDYDQKIDNNSFRIKVTGLADYQFHPKNFDLAQEFILFDQEKKTGKLLQNTIIADIDLKKINYNPIYSEIELSEYSNSIRTGFLKFELATPEMGFGSKLFPNLFSEAAIQNAKQSNSILGQKEVTKIDLPREAFAPQARSMSINYKASSKLNFNSDAITDNVHQANEKFIHIHPFGKEITFDKGIPKKEHLIGQYDHEASVFFGLKELELPANISFYFELEQNNSNNFVSSDIPELSWYYLSNNEWVKFDDSDLIIDTTNNFTTTGIIQIKVPTSLSINHEVMPTDVYWISVQAEKNTQYLSKIVFVKTNGASATWQAHKKEAYWQKNITPNSISGFKETKPEIKHVFQPYASFGGLKGETDDEFYFRISERLKNKNRVVCPSDYERLLLSKHSNLFQVMCFNSTIAPEFVKAGEVKIVLVPTIASKEFSLPRVGYNQLKIIEKELSDLASPFSKIQVINPVYETVRVSCTIQFENQSNSGQYVKKLRNDLRNFICPWFRSEQGEMEFGGSIERSVIFSFVDSLSYVNFVTGLSVLVLHDKNGRFSLSDSASDNGKLNRINSTMPWSVLVPDENHEIKITNRMVHSEPQEATIDTMQVGSYFVIAEESENDLKVPTFDRKKDVFYAIEFDI